MKKIGSMILLFTLLIFSLTGCKEETSSLPLCSQCQEEKQCITYEVDEQKYRVCSDCYDAFAVEMGLIKDSPVSDLPACSECKEQKECRTYDIDGQEYIVCDDCYDSFAANIGLIEDPEVTGTESDENTNKEEYDSSISEEAPPEEPDLIPVCSLCEMEKECDTYKVDGQKYIVCPDCYNEFAHAFGLIEEETDTQEDPSSSEIAAVLVCTGCERETECKIYDVDGVEYIVCDDCYIEFATGMGILE